jgi:hypothetical protein
MLNWLLEQGTKYEPLIKTGVAALSTYASYKDQQKKNELQQAAYDDYMAQADAAGHAARAAIDINYTPMTVSGVPQTKADVSDFTAVAARGGLMNLPTRQRKRYASQGFVEDDDIEIMEPESESLGDFELRQEEGVNIGEQVFHDTGDPMTNAKNVWNSGQINQDDYIDFNEFFQSGDWQDHISKVEVEGDMQMASAPSIDDDRNQLANKLFPGKNLKDLTETEVIQLDEFISQQMASGGIAGLRHGGRPGYAFGPGPVMDQETTAQSITLPDGGEEVVTDSMTDIKGQTAGPDWYIQRIEHLEFLFGDELTEDEIAEIAYDSDKYYEKIGHDPYAKGGRVKYAQGSGIMNLGGMEKDYRTTGGFVPIGAYEKKDDVPARLSKNEFVMTADAVRAAGGGSINKGAQRMYDTMKHLEAQPQAKRMTA